ncbi:MAG: hypothetical protein WCD57_14030 [Acidobacteriaceae bacterium]
MPKKEVSDLIADQEMAYARLLPEAVGLNPGTAAYTKVKPRVRACMLGCRAAMQQQEADLPRPAVEKLRRKEELREQILDRLWELAKLSPETTRNSITGQVKAIQMIAAIEGLIPDRRAASSGKKSAPPLPPADIYQAAWLCERQGKTTDPQPSPHLAQEEVEPHSVQPEPEPTPAAAADTPPSPAMPIGPAYDRSQSVFADLFHPSDADTKLPLWKQRLPAWRRR